MNLIADIRKINNMTQKSLAEKSGFTPAYINKLEKGTRKNPSKDAMEKIAGALGKTVSEVFFPDDKKSNLSA